MRALILILVSFAIFAGCAPKIETGYLTDTDPNYLVEDTLIMIKQQWQPASTDFVINEPTDEYGQLLADILRKQGYGLEVLSAEQLPLYEEKPAQNLIIYLVDQSPANKELGTPEMYRIKLLIGTFEYARAYKRSNRGLLMPITSWSRRG